MKDAKDGKTAELLKSPTAKRQAAFKERMRRAGYTQKTFWLLAAEVAAVAELLNQMRKGKS